MNKTITAAIACLLIATATPANAEITTFDEDHVYAVGDVLAFQEPILVPTPAGAYHLEGDQFAYFVTAEQNGGEGQNNIDGVLIPVPATVGSLSILNDCPQVGNTCYAGAGGVPDLDVFFYTENVDETGAHISWESVEGSCTNAGEEPDCGVPNGATHTYVTNWAGAPTWVTVTVLTVRDPTPHPCDITEEDVRTPSDVLTHGYQTERWNIQLPNCNHREANSWCADNGYPGRVTPGPQGPPAEDDGMVPSRCNDHPCFGSTPEAKQDETDPCYEADYTPVDTDDLDPVGLINDQVNETAADVDDISSDPTGYLEGRIAAAEQTAHDELNWTLSRPQVKWIREFTPLTRCSETSETLPEGCDEYWQE